MTKQKGLNSYLQINIRHLRAKKILTNLKQLLNLIIFTGFLNK